MKMIKLDIQKFGGRGASGSFTTKVKNSELKVGDVIGNGYKITKIRETNESDNYTNSISVSVKKGSQTARYVLSKDGTQQVKRKKRKFKVEE